jgi:hypothetical protein
MATPPQLIELCCPSCQQMSWVIVSAFDGIHDGMIPYDVRNYDCSQCLYNGLGWKVSQYAPPLFLQQPDASDPMTQEAFDYWVDILKTHFPDLPILQKLGKKFRPCLPEEAEAINQAYVRAHPVSKMTDQDGGCRVDPDLGTALIWLEVMKLGDSLVFGRRDGGMLTLNLDESGYTARCLDDSGAVLAEVVGLAEPTVRKAIGRYLNGDTAGCARGLRRPRAIL